MAKTSKSGAIQVQAFGNSYILSTNLGWVLCNRMYIHILVHLCKKKKREGWYFLNMDEFLTFYWQKGQKSLKFKIFFQMI